MAVQRFVYEGQEYQIGVPEGENPQKYFDSFVEQLNKGVSPPMEETPQTPAPLDLAADYQRYMNRRNQPPRPTPENIGMTHYRPVTEGPIPEHLQGTANPLIHAGRTLNPIVQGARRGVSVLKESFAPFETIRQRRSGNLPPWYLSSPEYQQMAREAAEFDRRRHPLSAQIAGDLLVGGPLGMASYVPRMIGSGVNATASILPRTAEFGMKFQRKANRLADAMVENRVTGIPFVSSGISGAGYGASEFVDPDQSPLDRSSERLRNITAGFVGGVGGEAVMRPLTMGKRLIDAERYKRDISGDLEEVVDIPAAKLYQNRPHLQTTESMAKSTEPGTIEAPTMTAARARADRQIERNARAINEELTGSPEFAVRGAHLEQPIRDLNQRFRSSKSTMNAKYEAAKRAGDVRGHNRYLGNLERSMENYLDTQQIKRRGKPKKILDLTKSLREEGSTTFSAHKLPILYQDINRELYNAKGGDRAILSEFKKYVENTMVRMRDETGFQGTPEALSKFLDATDFAARHYDTFVNNDLMRNTVIGKKFGKGKKYTPEEVSIRLLGAPSALESGGVFTADQKDFLTKFTNTVPGSQTGIANEFLNKLLSGHRSSRFSQEAFDSQYGKALQGGKADLFELFPDNTRKKLADLDRVVTLNSATRETIEDQTSMGPLATILTTPAPFKRTVGGVPLAGAPFNKMRLEQIRQGLIFREGKGIRGASLPSQGTYLPFAAANIRSEREAEVSEDERRRAQIVEDWIKNLKTD